MYKGNQSYIINKFNEVDSSGESLMSQLIEETDNTQFMETLLDLGVDINTLNEFHLIKIAIEKGIKILTKKEKT